MKRLKNNHSIFTPLFLALILLASSGFGQTNEPQFSSNPDLSFQRFISGVKYAQIEINSINQETIDKREGVSPFYFIGQQFLMEAGFDFVALTSSEKTQLENSITSFCQITSVLFGGDIDDKFISNLSLSFATCNGDFFTFKSSSKIPYKKIKDVELKLKNEWTALLGKKEAYDQNRQLSLPSNPTIWTMTTLKANLTANKLMIKPIEGLYEQVRINIGDYAEGKYSVGIIKNPSSEEYLMIYFSGARNSTDWKPGELKAVLKKTATKGFYSVEWIARDKSVFDDVFCNIDETGVTFYSTGITSISYKFIKTFPSRE